jgi:molybdopterin converting factor small subunit
VAVDFFGPFRAFGKGTELEIDGDVAFEELVTSLSEALGPAFRERAEKKNTTFILNNKIVARDRLGDIRIAPGDRVAFALLMGGG